MKKKEKMVKFPEDFFTKIRNEKKEPDLPVNMIPFEWPEEVLSGKKKATLYMIEHDDD